MYFYLNRNILKRSLGILIFVCYSIINYSKTDVMFFHYLYKVVY